MRLKKNKGLGCFRSSFKPWWFDFEKGNHQHCVKYSFTHAVIFMLPTAGYHTIPVP